MARCIPTFYVHLSNCIFFLGSVTQAPHVDGQHVTITYSNGDSCKGQVGKSYRTEITFICKTGLMVCKLEAWIALFSVFLDKWGGSVAKWARDLKSGDPELPLNLFEMVSCVTLEAALVSNERFRFLKRLWRRVAGEVKLDNLYWYSHDFECNLE